MTMAINITRDLATGTSCIDLSVRIVTKSSKVGSLLIFSISLHTVYYDVNGSLFSHLATITALL
jgi:hypothetical protein